MPPFAPFIVGAPRSGTTLLRMMLDAHPALAIPPETNFSFLFHDAARLPATASAFCSLLASSPNWVDFHLDAADLIAEIPVPFDLGAGLRAFYQLYARRFSKVRWGDKTPDYGLHLPALARLVPEARFVHIIRDGRDAAVSLRDLWFAPSRNYGDLAKYWSWRVQTIRQLGVQRTDYLEVRYEALLVDPASVLRAICAFIRLDWDESMLRYYDRSGERLQEHEGRIDADGNVVLTKAQRRAQQRLVRFPPDISRIGAWREVMTLDEIADFMREASPLLAELGYS